MEQRGKLSAAALESLAIIAYRQPITRAAIEGVRGVNSEGVLRTLLARSLVAPVGRLEQAGRPILYGTTFEFLQYFGIGSLAELPPLPDGDDDLGGKRGLASLADRAAKSSPREVTAAKGSASRRSAQKAI